VRTRSRCAARFGPPREQPPVGTASRLMVAGTSTVRTSVASRNTAAASADYRTARSRRRWRMCIAESENAVVANLMVDVDVAGRALARNTIAPPSSSTRPQRPAGVRRSTRRHRGQLPGRHS
jgi:hypothetical protein